MSVGGKTGADAIFKALHHICHVIVQYRTKLDNIITSAEGAEVITPDQANTARAFVAGADAFCTVFELIAGYSGF